MLGAANGSAGAASTGAIGDGLDRTSNASLFSQGCRVAGRMSSAGGGAVCVIQVVGLAADFGDDDFGGDGGEDES